MENLLVFYGDVVRNGISGLDVSQCESMNVVVKDMENLDFAEVRKCIRVQFGPEMRGKKMTVEAVICVGGDDGTAPRWGLREVKGNNSWRTYMRFATTPGAAMFQRPMVYVQFISPSDEPGCSSGAPEAQLAITGGPSSGRSEPMELELVPDPGYWSAVVDISERMEGLPEALDDDDDDHSSGSSSSEEEGVGPSQRAVAGPMPEDFLQTMTIRNEYHSVAGLGEASLEVGHSFPDKDSADQAIKRYALSISRQHRVKQSD